MKLYDETDCLPHVKPAFPSAPIAVSEGLSGLTKREYAAIHIAAAIVSGARMSARILIECSQDHGEHVALVRVGGDCPPCNGDCAQGRKCPAKQDRELNDLADAYLGRA